MIDLARLTELKIVVSEYIRPEEEPFWLDDNTIVVSPATYKGICRFMPPDSGLQCDTAPGEVSTQAIDEDAGNDKQKP